MRSARVELRYYNISKFTQQVAYYLCVLWWSSRKLMFSGPLQKDLFKGEWSSAETCFKQNYCHARSSPKVCRLLSSPVLLRKLTIISYDSSLAWYSVLIISFPNMFLLRWYASVRLSKKDTRIDTLIDSLRFVKFVIVIRPCLKLVSVVWSAWLRGQLAIIDITVHCHGPYFSVRSSRSSTLGYGLPSWFLMFRV